jgi:tRNA threonylcarbamoyladenosine modification (KEOPS) complex  Pcc1 subunit
MNVKAEFELANERDIVKRIYDSVKEEKDMGIDRRRSGVELNFKGTIMSVTISSDDIVGLRAASNTWLRLLKIAEEVIELCH